MLQRYVLHSLFRFDKDLASIVHKHWSTILQNYGGYTSIEKVFKGGIMIYSSKEKPRVAWNGLMIIWSYLSNPKPKAEVIHWFSSWKDVMQSVFMDWL